MKPMLIAMALTAALALAPPARAAPADEIRTTYERFVAAQNARDLAGVRALLLDSPDLLWVSDGRSVWGMDALLARMAGFQRAEIWRARPDLAQARIVAFANGTAYLHMPLALEIGSLAQGVQEYRFLVSILFVHAEAGWRIAALFTTTRNDD